MEYGSFLDPASTLETAKLYEGQTVVDFSSGGGFFTRAAARLVGDASVWAVDSSGELLSRIKSLAIAEGLTNVEIQRGTIETPEGSGLPSEFADVVIAANILFTAHNKEAVIKEIYRILKRGGRAVIIDWTDSHGGLGPHPEHVYKEEDARELCASVGLPYIESLEAGLYHWGFIVRKSTKKAAQ